MAERYRAPGLEPMKKQMAAGAVDAAKDPLEAKRAGLLVAYNSPDCTDRARVATLLTVTNSLLAERATLAGDQTEAMRWFDVAYHYCEGHEPLVEVRLNRQRGLLDFSMGDIDRAGEAMEDAAATLTSSRFKLATVIPEKRIEVELAHTMSCLAEIVLAEQPGHHTGIVQAGSVAETLQAKPRYELRNLMLRLQYTSRFLSPVQFGHLSARAWYVNERHVRNGQVRARLIDTASMAPMGSAARAVFGRIRR